MHGLISLVDVGAEGFIAYLWDMRDEHVYLYGEWLVEEGVPERGKGQRPLVASLLNVDSSLLNPGDNNIDPRINVVVTVSQAPQLTNPDVRAVLNLPRPRKIHYCISGDLANDSLAGPANSIGSVIGKPAQLSGIRIFEYTFSDPDKVTLTSDDGIVLWNCPESRLLVPVDNRNIAVLHFYDEPAESFPDEDTAQKHNQEEFNLSFKFLGVQLELVKQPGPILPVPLIPGLLPGEVDSLDQREIFALEAMFRARTGNNAPASKKGGNGGGQVCSPAHAVVVPGK